MFFSDRFIKNGLILYIYIPMIIFVLGWTNIFVALACTGVFIYIFYYINKFVINDERTRISVIVIVIAIIAIAFVCYTVGIGRFVDQNWDWEKHNSILSDLSFRTWPVYYNNKGEKSMLTYYIGQYIIPGLFGKVFNSFRLSEIVNYLWSIFGIFLVFIQTVKLINIRGNLKLYATLFLILFFNHGILGIIVRNIIYPSDFPKDPIVLFSGHGLHLDYSNHFFNLSFVFQQTIVIWMITLLFIEYKKHISLYAFFLLPCIIYGTICFVGFIPLVVGQLTIMSINKKKTFLKEIVNRKNILMVISWGMVLFLYFYGNVFSKKPNNIGFNFVNYGKWWPVFFIFIATQVVIVYLLILKDNKKNYLLMISVLFLCLAPLIKMGKYNDWLNAARPENFVLLVFVIKYINDITLTKWKNGKKIYKICCVLLIGFLVTGCYNPFLTIKNTIKQDDFSKPGIVKRSKMSLFSLEEYANRKDYYKGEQKEEDLAFNYYSYDLKNNYFYKYISRRKNK